MKSDSKEAWQLKLPCSDLKGIGQDFFFTRPGYRTGTPPPGTTIEPGAVTTGHPPAAVPEPHSGTTIPPGTGSAGPPTEQPPAAAASAAVTEPHCGTSGTSGDNNIFFFFGWKICECLKNGHFACLWPRYPQPTFLILEGKKIHSCGM